MENLITHIVAVGFGVIVASVILKLMFKISWSRNTAGDKYIETYIEQYPFIPATEQAPTIEEPPKPTHKLVKYTDFKVGKTYIVQGLTGYRYYSQVFEVIERTKIGLVVKSINLATDDRRVETFVIDENCVIFQSRAHTYVTTQLDIEDFLPYSIGAFTVSV